MLDKYSAGDYVAVDINLRGREWTNPEGVVKYFNQIQGWKINKIEKSDQPKSKYKKLKSLHQLQKQRKSRRN